MQVLPGTLGAFRAATKHLPDDTPLLIEGCDHEYAQVSCLATTALLDGRTYTEDHAPIDKRTLGEKTEYGVRVQVAAVS